MPELPEVETVRTGLAPSVTGGLVTGIEILDARSLRRHLAGTQDFVQTLTNRRVLDVVRRGKFLWMPLEPKPQDGEHRPSAVVKSDLIDAREIRHAVFCAVALLLWPTRRRARRPATQATQQSVSPMPSAPAAPVAAGKPDLDALLDQVMAAR